MKATQLTKQLNGLLKAYRRGSPAALRKLHATADRIARRQASESEKAVVLGALAAAFVVGLRRR